MRANQRGDGRRGWEWGEVMEAFVGLEWRRRGNDRERFMHAPNVHTSRTLSGWLRHKWCNWRVGLKGAAEPDVISEVVCGEGGTGVRAQSSELRFQHQPATSML